VWTGYDFEFDINGERSIEVIVMDEDTVSDDIIGKGTINIKDIIPKSSHQSSSDTIQQVQLYHKSKVVGKIKIRIRYISWW